MSTDEFMLIASLISLAYLWYQAKHQKADDIYTWMFHVNTLCIVISLLFVLCGFVTLIKLVTGLNL